MTDLKGKKIAVLGGTRISRQIVEAAHRLGMHVTVIDYNEPDKSPAKQIADEHSELSIANAKEVASYIKEHSINGVITGYTDSILGMYADICEESGLPCYGTREQFDIYANKNKWKQCCIKYSVPTAAIYSRDDLIFNTNVAYPVIIKPEDGSGSRGVSVVRSYEEVEPAWIEAEKWAKNGKVLAEQYLEGRECTAFWVMIDGRYYVSMLGNRHVKHNQEGCLPLPVGYSYPASVLPIYMQEVVPNIEKMFRETGIKNGMMFMQCIIVNGVPHVYDIGYRLTGSLEHFNQKAAAGYSTMDMLLQYAVTGKMTDDPDIEKKITKGLYAPAYNVSTLIRPGEIGSFSGINDVLEMKHVVACELAHIEGEILPKEARGQLQQITVRTLGISENREQVAHDMLEVQRHLNVFDENGQSMLLPAFESPDEIEPYILS